MKNSTTKTSVIVGGITFHFRLVKPGCEKDMDPSKFGDYYIKKGVLSGERLAKSSSLFKALSRQDPVAYPNRCPKLFKQIRFYLLNGKLGSFDVEKKRLVSEALKYGVKIPNSVFDVEKDGKALAEEALELRKMAVRMDRKGVCKCKFQILRCQASKLEKKARALGFDDIKKVDHDEEHVEEDHGIEVSDDSSDEDFDDENYENENYDEDDDDDETCEYQGFAFPFYSRWR